MIFEYNFKEWIKFVKLNLKKAEKLTLSGSMWTNFFTARESLDSFAFLRHGSGSISVTNLPKLSTYPTLKLVKLIFNIQERKNSD